MRFADLGHRNKDDVDVALSGGRQLNRKPRFADASRSNDRHQPHPGFINDLPKTGKFDVSPDEDCAWDWEVVRNVRSQH